MSYKKQKRPMLPYNVIALEPPVDFSLIIPHDALKEHRITLCQVSSQELFRCKSYVFENHSVKMKIDVDNQIESWIPRLKDTFLDRLVSFRNSTGCNQIIVAFKYTPVRDIEDFAQVGTGVKTCTLAFFLDDGSQYAYRKNQSYVNEGAKEQFLKMALKLSPRQLLDLFHDISVTNNLDDMARAVKKELFKLETGYTTDSDDPQ